MESVVERPPRSEEDDNPAIHYGIIASANQLMKDAVVRDALVAEKGILCFEMEAAGLMNRFPCLVIRGICDYSDSHKNKDWQGYAAMAAAAYAKELLKRMVPSRVESEERLRKALACISNEMTAIQFTAQKTDDSLGALRSQNQSDKIRKWLLLSDPSTNYVRALHQRQEGTGLWFLQSETFKCWRKEPNSFLWLSGIPGCGKTVLSSAIIQCLGADEPSAVQPVLLYFFFDFNNTHKQSVDDMARSIVVQLYHQHSETHQDLELLFKSHQDGAKEPVIEQLTKTLQTMLSRVTEATIVLDALDESTTRPELFTWIHDFCHSNVTKLHVIVTARLDADIDSALRVWTTEKQRISLQSKVVNEDIRAHVNERVRHDKGLSRWHSWPDIQKKIESQSMEKADGMFRWASCQLDALEKCYNVPMLRKALSCLPTTLDQTYERILDDIPEIVRPYAVTVLRFLTYSPRPLRLLEILDAIATNPQEKPAFRPENRFPNPREVLNICSSLVNLVTRESANVDTAVPSHNDDGNHNISTNNDDGMLELRLAHFSVKEYLISDRVHGMFKGPLEEINSKASMKTRGAFPFAEYCAKYWTTFATVAEDHSENVQQWIDVFLNHKKAYTTSCFLFDPDESRMSYWGWRENETPSLLCYASSTGLRVFVQSLLKGAYHDGDDDVPEDVCNALYAASFSGHDEIVRLFLNKGVYVDTQDVLRCTPLIAASKQGHEKVIQTLLDWGADINVQSWHLGTPLMAATAYGRVKVVRKLLDEGADVNINIKPHYNALGIASWMGHKKIIQVLIESGADVNTQGEGGQTPLLAASAHGNEEVVHMLLARGVDVNAVCNNCNTALITASAAGREKVVQILLDRGADVNVRVGLHHDTALVIASMNGHKQIVQMLLHRGVNLVESDDGAWGGAIEEACSERHFGIVQMLLDHEIKEDSLSRYLKQFPPPSTSDDPEGQMRLEKESKCRDVIYTAIQGIAIRNIGIRNIAIQDAEGEFAEGDFAELINRHIFLYETWGLFCYLFWKDCNSALSHTMD